MSYKLRFLTLVVFIFIGAQSSLGYVQTVLIKDLLENIKQAPVVSEIVLLFIYSLLAFLCSIGGQQTGVFVANRYARDIRAAYYDKVFSMSLADIEKFTTSSLITRATNDVQIFQIIFFSNAVFLVRGLSLFIGGLVTALTINLALSSLLLLIIPAFLVVIVYYGKKAQPFFQKGRKLLDTAQDKMHETIIGSRVIKSYNLERVMFERFDKVDLALTKNDTRANSLLARISPIVQAFLNVANISIVLIVGLLVATKQADSRLFSIIISFVQILLRVTIGMYIIAYNIVEFSSGVPSIMRLVEILNYQENTYYPPTSAQKMEGEIEFRNLSFAYQKGQKVLKEINLKIANGQKIGIIGQTGAGKTTLLNLIYRAYDASEGELLINGINIKNYSKKDLSENIAIASQKSEILQGTIRDNLLMSSRISEIKNPQKQDQAIWQSLELAKAATFVRSYPEKLLAPTAQRGNNLSGGQKQRLSIARTIAQKAKITIFDDSTSALDTNTEAQVLENIFNSIETTLIIVAQRISTVKRMDRIVVLENGAISGIGSHHELLKTNRLYYDIALAQREIK